jgi:hypothetical protein
LSANTGEKKKKEGRTDVLELAVKNVDHDLATVDDSEHDEGERRDRFTVVCHQVYELRRMGEEDQRRFEKGSRKRGGRT